MSTSQQSNNRVVNESAALHITTELLKGGYWGVAKTFSVEYEKSPTTWSETEYRNFYRDHLEPQYDYVGMSFWLSLFDLYAESVEVNEPDENPGQYIARVWEENEWRVIGDYPTRKEAVEVAYSWARTYGTTCEVITDKGQFVFTYTSGENVHSFRTNGFSLRAELGLDEIFGQVQKSGPEESKFLVSNSASEFPVDESPVEEPVDKGYAYVVLKHGRNSSGPVVFYNELYAKERAKDIGDRDASVFIAKIAGEWI